MTALRMAQIGGAGQGIDVAAGGDVDPTSGRLLSVAQLQQALRLAVAMPAAGPLVPLTAPVPASGASLVTAPAVVLSAAALLADAAGISSHPVAVTPAVSKPEQWWADDEGTDLPDDDAAAALAVTASTKKLRRRTAGSRVSIDPNGSTAAGRARGRGMRLARRVLGLHRPEGAVPAGAAGTGGSPGGSATGWLSDSGTGEVMPAGDPTAGPQDASAAAGGEPVRSTRRVSRPPQDLEVSRAPRELGATVRRALIGLVLLLIAFAGLKQIVWNPIFGAAAGTAADGPAGMDQVAADGAATRYALDYLSYSPAAASTAAAAVTADVVAGDAAPPRWAGSGYLHADTALPGSWHVLDAAHAVVSVTVRVHLAMPPTQVAASGAAPTAAAAGAAAPSGSGSASDPGAIPAGWTDLGSRWLTLAVPVQSSGGVVKVSPSGAVLSGEAPTLVTAGPAWSADPATTTATAPVVTSFFPAYAQSNAGYLAEPGVDLAGLAGTVTVASVTGWNVLVPPAPVSGSASPASSGVGAAAVTWQLAGTDLQIQQSYSVALTNSQSRWYIAALSPVLSTTAQ